MQDYSLAQVGDSELLANLGALVARDRLITAVLLAHLSEVDARKLYAPAGYSSMYAYCVGELRFSENEAKKRILVSRIARRFPSIFAALAQGNLHVSGLCVLAPHLTQDNARALIEASLCKTRIQIEEFLARRFPIPREPAYTDRPIPGEPAEQVPSTGLELLLESSEGSPGNPPELQIELVPESQERYFLQFSIPKATHENLRYAQDLLSHAVPDGDLAQLLDRALKVLIPHLESRKFSVIHAKEHVDDVATALRDLGCGAQEARRAAEIAPHGVTLEERMLEALRYLSSRKTRVHTVKSGP